MRTLILAALALLILAVVALIFSAPMLALPLFVLALIVGAFGLFARRAAEPADIQKERENARAQKTQFTERDRQTQV
jgi:Na+/glutamate symporter